MTTQNPQVLRTHFTELALHLAIDPTEHPSDIIQETIRRLEYLKHDHRTLLTRYDEAQQARIRNPAELVEEIEDLDRDNAKLQRRYVALAQRCRELKAECQGLGRECEALRERVGGQERLIGELGELGDVLEMYVASSREGFEGIRVSAEGFLGEVAEVLGFRGDDGFDQEVVLDTIMKLTIDSSANVDAAATARMALEDSNHEANEAKQKVKTLEKRLRAKERESNGVLNFMGQWHGMRY